MTDQNACVQESPCQADVPTPKQSRERLPWCEITTDEKLDRIRIVVKQALRQIDNIGNNAQQARSIACEHIHDANGRVHKPVNSYDGPMGIGSEKSLSPAPGKEWF